MDLCCCRIKNTELSAVDLCCCRIKNTELSAVDLCCCRIKNTELSAQAVCCRMHNKETWECCWMQKLCVAWCTTNLGVLLSAEAVCCMVYNKLGSVVECWSCVLHGVQQTWECCWVLKLCVAECTTRKLGSVVECWSCVLHGVQQTWECCWVLKLCVAWCTTNLGVLLSAEAVCCMVYNKLGSVVECWSCVLHGVQQTWECCWVLKLCVAWCTTNLGVLLSAEAVCCMVYNKLGSVVECWSCVLHGVQQTWECCWVLKLCVAWCTTNLGVLLSAEAVCCMVYNKLGSVVECWSCVLHGVQQTWECCWVLKLCVAECTTRKLGSVVECWSCVLHGVQQTWECCWVLKLCVAWCTTNLGVLLSAEAVCCMVYNKLGSVVECWSCVLHGVQQTWECCWVLKLYVAWCTTNLGVLLSAEAVCCMVYNKLGSVVECWSCVLHGVQQTWECCWVLKLCVAWCTTNLGVLLSAEAVCCRMHNKETWECCWVLKLCVAGRSTADSGAGVQWLCTPGAGWPGASGGCAAASLWTGYR